MNKIERQYEYMLPRSGTSGKEYSEIDNRSTACNAVVIIGANGSGKSKLGAWIEKHETQSHRIGAQRALTFGKFIMQKSYEQSINYLSSGDENNATNRDTRWQWDGEKYNYTSSMLNDYEYVLAALLAKRRNEITDYENECKQREAEGHPHKKWPTTVTDTVKLIWNQVYPQRKISFDDDKVTATIAEAENDSPYQGVDMSDGERVALYLIAQILSIPENKTVIVDEPELHLHRSILNRLWTAIEKERPDCLFIYITHDTQFAANHRNADKIWVKSFDGNSWDWEYVSNSDMPEQLLLDILGNRKQVIFVEGTVDSLDTKLYEAVYEDYYVVPCGSCTEVIARTKAMNNTPQLSHIKAYGIIDRDYRSDTEIASLSKKGVFTLNVAEVENLFIVEEMLSLVNQSQNFTDSSRISIAKDYISTTKFANAKTEQIRKATIAECKYQYSIIDIGGIVSDDEMKCLTNLISYEKIHAEISKRYEVTSYEEILALFNEKELCKSIGTYFGLENPTYCDYVLRLARGAKNKDVCYALRPYLPKGIPLGYEELGE